MNVKKVCIITALFASMLYLLHSYIPAALWAGIFSIILFPLIKRFPIRNESISAIVYISLLIVFVLLPIVITVVIATNEITHYVNHHDIAKQINYFVKNYVSRLPMSEGLVNKIQHLDWKKEILGKLNFSTMKSSISIFQILTSSITHLVFNVLFFILFLYYFLINSEKIKLFVKAYCLDPFKKPDKILKEIINGTRGVSSALFVTSIIVALIMTPVYIFVGLPLPVFFGMVSAFLAMIPFTLPILYLLLAGICFLQSHIIGSVVILAIGLVLNFLTDNFLQPKIVQNNTKMHFLVSFLGVIGGLETLGIIGVFIGPVLINLAYIFVNQLIAKKA